MLEYPLLKELKWVWHPDRHLERFEITS